MKGKPRSVRKAKQTGSALHKEPVEFAQVRAARAAALARMSCAQRCAMRERALRCAAKREAIRNMKMPSHPRPLTKEERLDKHWR